jgi:HlyD family secretion protein
LKKVWIPMAILAIVTGAWLYSRKPEIPTVPFAKVRRENLVSVLPSNGKVEPLEWSAVRAEVSALIDKVAVQQGQSVAAGAALATLRLTGVQADLTVAEAQIARARAQLADIERGGHKAELAGIENELQHARFEKQAAQRDLDALTRLLQKNAATRFEVDAARNKVTEAQIQIDAATRKKAALISADDKSVAEALLRQGEAAKAAAEKRSAQAEVRSPIGGVIYNLAVRQGAYVNMGDLIANVGRLDRLRVRVYVDEPELGRVAVGQPVTISWDALPRETWTGVVDKTPTEVIALGTRQVGEVLCTIENTNGKLVPGTNVNAEIRTNSASGALTIPKEAVRRQGVDSAVFVLQDGKVALRQIKTGVSSATRVEVVSGLSEGDSVALPIEAPLKDGDPVKAVYP